MPRPSTFGAVWHRAWARTPSVLGVTLLTYLLIAVQLLATAFIQLVSTLTGAQETGSTRKGGRHPAVPTTGPP
ncbi:hypothetical protein ABZ214_10970 [Streptomyces iakyrus]|uniref:hypothetical protein n=1 Tax=Streptomyces iakyrus TaxID=68219 RepID=UPI0033B766FC